MKPCLTLTPMVASKYLVHSGGCLGVGVQIGGCALETALLEPVHEIAQKLVGVLLSALSERLGYR